METKPEKNKKTEVKLLSMSPTKVQATAYSNRQFELNEVEWERRESLDAPKGLYPPGTTSQLIFPEVSLVDCFQPLRFSSGETLNHTDRRWEDAEESEMRTEMRQRGWTLISHATWPLLSDHFFLLVELLPFAIKVLASLCPLASKLLRKKGEDVPRFNCNAPNRWDWKERPRCAWFIGLGQTSQLDLTGYIKIFLWRFGKKVLGGKVPLYLSHI